MDESPIPTSHNRRPAKSAGSGKHVLDGRYELIECVGEGATGCVYSGVDLTTGNSVAVRVIRPELVQSQSDLGRLKKEVETIANLSHSNLGHVYGYGGEIDGAPYLIMEFVEGPNLANVIKTQGKLDYERSLDIFLQICSGLSCAHTSGIIHRDLKPGNVILQRKENGQERIAIVDFGFAKVLQRGNGLSDAAYMSPEESLGQQVDLRSDIYSLGCLMYEALAAVPPNRENPMSLRSRNTTVPEEFDNIVMKCLTNEPMLRYQSTGALRQDLDKVKQGDFDSVSAKSARKNVVVSDKKSLRKVEGDRQERAMLIGSVLAAIVVIGAILAGCAWFFTRPAATPPEVQTTAPAQVAPQTLPADGSSEEPAAPTGRAPSETSTEQ